jgi:hypothetical protein
VAKKEIARLLGRHRKGLHLPPKDPIYKMEAMKIIDLLPKAMRKEFQKGDHLEALARFRRECPACGLVVNNSLEDLAIAQHHGLATHLLDWTTNPLVALFFASEEARNDLGNRMSGEVFVLNNQKPVNAEEIKDDNWREISGLKLYNPRLIDARIVRQKSLFTIQGLDSKAVPELLASPHELVRHKVPAKLKIPLREILYQMGIDRSICFPLRTVCATE